MERNHSLVRVYRVEDVTAATVIIRRDGSVSARPDSTDTYTFEWRQYGRAETAAYLRCARANGCTVYRQLVAGR